jgi:hypothetical protein
MTPFQFIGYVALDVEIVVNDELQKMSQEAPIVSFRVFSYHLPDDTEVTL